MPEQRPERQPDPDGAFVERRHLPGTAGGPLSGTAFAVKDNISVEGMACTAGHPMFAGLRADRTATAVRRLLDAGADFVGMTTTDAGAFGATTPLTANPLFPDRVVGGSSGGSAAAVARGHCDFALGTDTGGSVRIPAACTGLAAFKPTFGRIPTDGVRPLAPTMDHVGVIARDLPVLRRAAAALLGSPLPQISLPADRGRLRILVESDTGGLWETSIAALLDDVAARLESAGHEVRRFAVPDRNAVADAHGILVLAEAAPIHAAMAANGFEGLGDAARRALRHAATIDDDTKRRAAAALAGIRAWSAATMAECDLTVSPTLPIPPPLRETRRISVGGTERPVVVAMTFLTCLANMTGSPAIALPVPASVPGELPGSLQLTGRLAEDEALFAAAARIARDLELGTAP